MSGAIMEMREIIGRHAPAVRADALPRVRFHEERGTHRTIAGVYPPMMALILSGAKEITVGDRRLRYDPARYFVAAVELPASGCVALDRPGEDYLAVALELDGDRLASLLPEQDAPPTAEPAFATDEVTPALLDAWLRLVRLLDAPGDVATLAPLCEQEILYRLLQGPQGALLRQITHSDSRLSRIRRAIALIRSSFDRPLRTEALADAAGMSAASLHRHFRAATAMSPLQYQKSLRLQEARRLIAGGRQIAGAAYAVGYESASQFSREYARMFGVSPSRDAGVDGGERRAA